MKPYDITLEQWGTLKRLWQQDGISPKCIAELKGIDQQEVQKLLEILNRIYENL